MPEDAGPLLTLGRRLRSLGLPPSLSVLIARLEGVEEYEDFAALVRELLPDSEQEILGEATPQGQIGAFVNRFQERYFPLEEGVWTDAEGYYDLTRGIPVTVLSISMDDYFNIDDFRPGLQLMCYLLAAPDWAEPAARVAIAEACAEHVPVDLLSRVPEGGFARETVQQLVQGGPHEALAHWAGMLEWDTGNEFLDITYEDCFDLPPWSRENVEFLTRQWQQAERIHQEVFRMVEWLEEAPPARFAELLDFMERRGEPQRRLVTPPPAQQH